MVPIPTQLHPVLRALGRVGRPRLVGGCVRDALLGKATGDIDIEVGGVTFDDLVATLRPFGATDVVGRSFGTVKLRLDQELFDFSLPRRESKVGAGHRGFRVEPDPALSDAAAAARRDFTINAMAWDPSSEALIDPFDGANDLKKRVLRHTSDAFAEDPLRVLRGMQLAARFDLRLAPETVSVCRAMVATHDELPVERIWGEWNKWATLARRPSAGLRVLEETTWLQHYPEIAALRGTLQDPEWHPEGDVLTHTAWCLDALAADPDWQQSGAERRRQLMLAVLAHDFGKPPTTVRVNKNGRMRWTSPGHGVAGLPLAASFLQRIGAPLAIRPTIEPLVQHHLVLHDFGRHEPSDAAVRRLARRLAPATIADLCTVMRADTHGRPPREDTAILAAIDILDERAAAMAIRTEPPRPLLLGRHLIAGGLSPGPRFKTILDQAYEAQLDGAYLDESGALLWLDSHLREPAP